MKSVFYKVLVLALGFSIATVAVRAQLLKEIAKPSIAKKEIAIAPDGKGQVDISMTIKDGWWSYGVHPTVNEDGIGPQATTFAIVSPKFVKLGEKVRTSKPKKLYDPNFELDVEKFIGRAEFYVPLEVEGSTKPGKYDVALEMYYMACDSSRCLTPDADTLRFTIVVPENMGAAVESQSGDTSDDKTMGAVESKSEDNNSTGTEVTRTDSQREIDKKKEEGLWAFFGFAMAHGALALLTPCVFPMIPITVSFFTKRAEKQRGKSHGLRDSLVYSIGIILTFTAIGFLFALAVGASGLTDFATNPWVNLVIAGVFLVLALNLFGAFEIRVPSGILNTLNARSNEGDGIGSVLLMGLTFSLTSFTCTVPFVSNILVSVSSGDWLYPIVGMLGFASVFAAPFFFLALFPTAMTAMPRAGGWMNNVKVVMGFLEIAAAIKFISNADLVWAWGIFSREMFLAIWIACSIMASLYILGIFHLPHDSKVERVGAPRILFSLFFASITFYLLSGLFGKPLGELDAFLPPANYHELMSIAHSGGDAAAVLPVSSSNNAEAGHGKNWIMSYEEGLRIAKETGKPIFIDFTGFTCTNCRWMEANVFPQSDVMALMDNMVKVQLYTDRREEPYSSNKKMQLERFGSIELPLYVILTPDGEFVASKAFTRNKQEFLEFLRKAS